MTITAFPLTWPAGWQRGPSHKFGRFGTGKTRTGYNGSSYMRKESITVAEAVSRVRGELGRMGLRGDDIVISTNLALRLDGLPRSDQREPDDSGAAAYWIDKAGATRCMAIDCYTRVADNLAAIAATLEAMRAIERHGGAEILDRAFTGFTALPGPDGDRPHWSDVLGVARTAPRAEIEAAYRTLRGKFHPDRAGGDAEAFQRVQRAFEDATR